jgi:OOP family OmpA-OmpF porin
MKKTLIAAALAVTAVLPFAAQADASSQTNDFFVAGNLGQSNARDGLVTHKTSVFQNVRFGWRWNGIVGAEVGYAYLGRAKLESAYDALSIKNQAATVGVTAKYDFVPNWYVTGHAGYARMRTTGTWTAGDNTTTSRDWNNGWYAGAGVGYNLSSKASLGLNYDNYHVKAYSKGNIAAYSVSYEYRF